MGPLLSQVLQPRSPLNPVPEGPEKRDLSLFLERLGSWVAMLETLLVYPMDRDHLLLFV